MPHLQGPAGNGRRIHGLAEKHGHRQAGDDIKAAVNGIGQRDEGIALVKSDIAQVNHLSIGADFRADGVEPAAPGIGEDKGVGA